MRRFFSQGNFQTNLTIFLSQQSRLDGVRKLLKTLEHLRNTDLFRFCLYFFLQVFTLQCRPRLFSTTQSLQFVAQNAHTHSHTLTHTLTHTLHRCNYSCLHHPSPLGIPHHSILSIASYKLLFITHSSSCYRFGVSSSQKCGSTISAASQLNNLINYEFQF